MQLQTILNQVEPFKSFLYRKVRWGTSEAEGDRPVLEVLIEPRANGRALCSGCGCAAPGYDRLAQRRFEFGGFLGIGGVFFYSMARGGGPRCGVSGVAR